jgi:hypothetical protein
MRIDVNERIWKIGIELGGGDTPVANGVNSSLYSRGQQGFYILILHASPSRFDCVGEGSLDGARGSCWPCR